MNNKILRNIFIFLLGIIIFIPSKINAASDYTIDKYEINMIVNENNTFDITENITANFKVPKHGIYRKIPLKNKVKRVDGTQSSNIVKITNIDVNKDYTLSKSGGYQIIQIGNSNVTLTGNNQYIIKYTYNIGKDKLKDEDELYFNLIGDKWDTTINNISFKIVMPKEFDTSKLGFSTGTTGIVGTSNVPYNVTGNVITGSVTKTLQPNEGLTIRLTLPDGYFVGASSNFDVYSIVVIIVSIICVIVAYIWWQKYGKDDEIVETVEFYPPEGYNSAEIGFIYNGTAENDGIISLLIYLANKGYLKIEEKEEKTLFSKTKGFKLTKIKDYDGNNEIERIFLEDLFKSGKSSVSSSELTNRFYMTLNKIKNKLNSKVNKNKIFESVASGKTKWLIMMIIAIYTLIIMKPVIEYQEPSIIIFALLFPLAGLFAFLSIISDKSGAIYVNGVPTSSKIAKMIFGLFFLVLFTIIPFCSIIIPAITQLISYMVMSIVGIISIIIVMIFVKIMPKRTPFGNEMLGKILGFRRFLETAEKTRLESLVEQNPEYFYNILPYI